MQKRISCLHYVQYVSVYTRMYQPQKSNIGRATLVTDVIHITAQAKLNNSQGLATTKTS